MTVVLIVHNLLTWTGLVALDGYRTPAEPKRLCYCLLHAAGVSARSGRRVRLRLAAGWPWSGEAAPTSTPPMNGTSLRPRPPRSGSIAVARFSKASSAFAASSLDVATGHLARIAEPDPRRH